MKRHLAALALAAAFAQPAAAITFPSLTTIYVGVGIVDDGSAPANGVATVFHCGNVSGVSAQVRFLILDREGDIVGNHTATVPHGQNYSVGTNFVLAYNLHLNLDTGLVIQGVANIESTQSGVFCSAGAINAAAGFPDGVAVPLVRVNAHPGTVE
jgi:hypothetical protein